VRPSRLLGLIVALGHAHDRDQVRAILDRADPAA
jgi:hypothetical protein